VSPEGQVVELRLEGVSEDPPDDEGDDDGGEGCMCRAAGAGRSPVWPWAPALLAAVALCRLRRRRDVAMGVRREN
jgi:MYXO-CTERM domain-containing protein